MPEKEAPKRPVLEGVRDILVATGRLKPYEKPAKVKPKPKPPEKEILIARRRPLPIVEG